MNSLPDRKYLTLVDVIHIHREIIREFGGPEGIRDRNGLISAVMRPQTGYYNNLLEEAAALMESLANNHPFIDGNKRIAFFATDIFLRMNGKMIEADGNQAHAHFMDLFNQGNFTFQYLLDWLNKHTK